MNDPYRTLGVAPTATKAEIKAAYRRLARKWHPDLHGQSPKAAQRFRAISEAYEALANAKPKYVPPVPDSTPIWKAEPAAAYAGRSPRQPKPAQTRTGDPIDDFASDILEDAEGVVRFFTGAFSSFGRKRNRT